MMHKIPSKSRGKICPKCHKQYKGYPAISRRDNKTEICSSCGQLEALEDFWKYRVRDYK